MLLMLSSGVVAYAGQYTPATNQSLGSFYVGAELSHDMARFNTRTVSNIPVRSGFETFFNNYNYDWNAEGIDGGLFAGYKLNITPLFTLSLEAFGDVSSARGNFAGTAILNEVPALLQNMRFQTKIKITHSVGVSLLPGINVNHYTNIFARVGWIYSHFKFTNSSTYDGSLSGAPFAFTAGSLKSSTNQSALQVGLGMTSRFNSNFGVRMEYDWASYGDINDRIARAPLGSIGANVPLSYDATAKLSPSIEQFKLAMFYRFDGVPNITDFKGGVNARTVLASGFYIGANVSRDFANFDTDINHISGTFGPQSLITRSQPVSFDWNAQGINGGVFVGYRFLFNHRYDLGIEAFADASSLKGNFKGAYISTGARITSKAKVESPYTVGVSVLPGVQLNPETEIFARIGWAYSRFKFSDNSNLSDDGVTTNLPAQPLKLHENSSGLQLGLGMETALTTELSLRMEYDWACYGSIKKQTGPTNIGGNFQASPTIYSASIKLRPTINTFKVGLDYHFV